MFRDHFLDGLTWRLRLFTICGHVVYSVLSETIHTDFDAQRPSEEHVHHPPDEKQRYDTKNNMGDPITCGLRFAKVEHARMVARG
jgi:hypothetical protein